jgi:hypothetical protein
MLHHPPLLREKSSKTKTTFLIKKINILLKLLYTVQNVKTVCMYVCAVSYLEINKCNIRNWFYRLLSLVLFCWCLPYKRPAVISQHVWVPFTALCFFLSGYILMEPFTVLVREGSHISRKKIQVDLHVAPQGTLWGKQLPHEFYVVFWSFISRKVAACVFKRVSDSSAGSIQFIFEVEVLKKLFYLRTDDNAKDVVAVSPSQSTLQCSTSSSYKITLSRPFVEVSTADTVAERRLWGGPIPNQVVHVSLSDQAAVWYCTLKNLGLPSYLA